MSFPELLLLAKDGQSFAVERIIVKYRPLLTSESIVNGIFDEDLYQEMTLILMHCIRKFKI